MRTDTRLPRVLHLLMHLDEVKEPITSEALGELLEINPSLIRRTMAGLRNAGIVTTTKGHGGGWTLSQPINKISLLTVFETLDAPNIFSIGLANAETKCLLEQEANKATLEAMDLAVGVFREHLAGITIGSLVKKHKNKIKRHQ